jgi:hypothetical protein
VCVVCLSACERAYVCVHAHACVKTTLITVHLEVISAVGTFTLNHMAVVEEIVVRIQAFLKRRGLWVN